MCYEVFLDEDVVYRTSCFVVRSGQEEEEKMVEEAEQSRATVLTAGIHCIRHSSLTE